MSNEKKPAEGPQYPHVEKKLETIPARAIFSPGDRPFCVPGKISGSSVTSNTERPSNRDYHWVEFIPAMRVFAVYFYKANQKTPEFRYVGEASVRDWEPLT